MSTLRTSDPQGTAPGQAPPTGQELPPTAEHLAEALQRARSRTLAICDSLDADQQRTQVSPLMSPPVWDLAHVANYEELWLLRALDGAAPIDTTLDHLYDAFEHPRSDRSHLPLLGPEEARAYGAQVRDRVLATLCDTAGDPGQAADARNARLRRDGYAYGLVIQHEHQHCETLLATLALMGRDAPPVPGASLTGSGVAAPGRVGADPDPVVTIDPGAIDWVDLPAGAVTLGTDTEPWAYDNERPAHQVELPAFRIARHPVTNRQWLAFIDAGGYDNPALWSPEGWASRIEDDLTAPLHWRRDDADRYVVVRFGRELPVVDVLDEPVQHICFHEAEAFARFAGARLPSEAEWERAARDTPLRGANLGQRHDGPLPVHRSSAGPEGVAGLFGDVWEWTASPFVAYPGFEPFPYEEYSAVFFGDDYRVLRGGSWATDPLVMRSTFRNWDYPIRRQIFSGVRLAADR